MHVARYILALSRKICRTGNAAMRPLYTAQPHLTVNSTNVSSVAFTASRRQQYNLLRQVAGNNTTYLGKSSATINLLRQVAGNNTTY
jgi:hypothetical protein